MAGNLHPLPLTAPPLPAAPSAAVVQNQVGAERADWVDAAKGLGIVLVVLGHTIDGAASAHLLPSGSLWQAAWYWIYTFHMPLFFGLAGLFVERRVTRDRAAFWAGLGPRLVWPYVLWSTVQLLVIGALGGAVNKPEPFTVGRWVALLWAPLSQFWFLHALLLTHLVASVVLPRAGRAVLLALALLALPVPALFELPYIVAQPCHFAVFYALGVWLGPQVAAPGRATLHAGLAMLAGLASIALAAQALTSGAAYWSVACAPAAIAGIWLCGLLSQLPAVANASALRFIGQRSMAIFLLHVFFAAGARMALRRFAHLQDGSALIVLATAAGVIGPLLVHAAATRARLDAALGLR